MLDLLRKWDGFHDHHPNPVIQCMYFLDVKCLEDINKENRYIITQRMRWLDGIINSMP